MPDSERTKARLPPRWFIRLAWITHRRLYRWTGGRLGLWRPKPGGWGTPRLTTIGRRTGRARAVIVGYFEDGPNFVTMAMNGWGDPEPAWWLNLQAHPDVTVDLVDGARQVTGRAAQGDERERLWARRQQIDKNLDAYAAQRSRQTAVVVLEPRRHSHDKAPRDDGLLRRLGPGVRSMRSRLDAEPDGFAPTPGLAYALPPVATTRAITHQGCAGHKVGGSFGPGRASRREPSSRRRLVRRNPALLRVK